MSSFVLRRGNFFSHLTFRFDKLMVMTHKDVFVIKYAKGIKISQIKPKYDVFGMSKKFLSATIQQF